jgi:hypothetical protein
MGVVHKRRIWTWDRGRRWVDMDAPSEVLVPILQTVLEGSLWREFEKFPADTVARLLPRLDIPANVRRLLEIWIEERARPAA